MLIHCNMTLMFICVDLFVELDFFFIAIKTKLLEFIDLKISFYTMNMMNRIP